MRSNFNSQNEDHSNNQQDHNFNGKGEHTMSTLTDVTLDLTAINFIEMKAPQLNFILPPLLIDLGNDLTGSGITSITSISLPNLPSITYSVEYGPSFNAFFSNPFLNYIFVGDNSGDVAIGGFGHSIFIGGTGDDTFYGFLDSAGTPANPAPAPSGNGFFVSKIMYGGDGNDTLVGLFGTLNTSYQSDNIVGTTFIQGNTLFGGNGNDHLYGEFINFINITVGDPLHPFTGIMSNINGVTDINGVPHNGHYLDGGAGDDYIVGNAGNVIINVSNVQAHDEDFISNNTLIGGAGNDILIGSFDSYNQTYTNDSGSNIHHYGNNHLDGGTGDDLLIGNIRTLSVTLTNSPNWNEEELFGSNVLIGGSGNDTLIGNAQTVTTSPGVTVVGGNNILFGGTGNDTLTGGVLNNHAANYTPGHNQFVYDGCLNNGQDTITDFNKALDALVGQNGAKFSDGGHNTAGDLVVKVADAACNTSTITLVGVHDNFSAILPDIHYVASPIV